MKPRNQQKKLSARITDYSLSMREKNTQASGTQQRKDSGGFHMPGSNKK